MVPIRLVHKNLFKHPLRTLLTLGSLVIALFLLCVLRSVVVTLDAGVESARSNRIIVQSEVSLFVDLPLNYGAKIRGVDGVKEICGWNWFGGYYQEPANFFAQFAVDQETLLPMYPEIVIIDGSEKDFFAARKGCIVGADIARNFNWKVGQSVPIISALYPRQDGRPWDFDVKAIYRSESSNVDNRTFFFHFDYLDESIKQGAVDMPRGVGIYVVQVKDGVDPLSVMASIDGLFENGPQRVQSTSEAEFQAQFVSMVGNVPFFVSSIGGGVFLAVLLAVVNTILMAAREQTRDVGILKALGFRRQTVFVVLLLQALFLTLLGGGIGVGLAVASSDSFANMLGTAFPNYGVSPDTVALGLGVSALIGVLAGLTPAITLSRLSPVEALRKD